MNIPLYLFILGAWMLLSGATACAWHRWFRYRGSLVDVIAERIRDEEMAGLEASWDTVYMEERR